MMLTSAAMRAKSVHPGDARKTTKYERTIPKQNRLLDLLFIPREVLHFNLIERANLLIFISHLA